MCQVYYCPHERPGKLFHCLAESDAESQAQARRSRRKSLLLSLTIELTLRAVSTLVGKKLSQSCRHFAMRDPEGVPLTSRALISRLPVKSVCERRCALVVWQQQFLGNHCPRVCDSTCADSPALYSCSHWFAPWVLCQALREEETKRTARTSFPNITSSG